VVLPAAGPDVPLLQGGFGHHLEGREGHFLFLVDELAAELHL
jgi:hypothetical protein